MYKYINVKYKYKTIYINIYNTKYLYRKKNICIENHKACKNKLLKFISKKVKNSFGYRVNKNRFYSCIQEQITRKGNLKLKPFTVTSKPSTTEEEIWPKLYKTSIQEHMTTLTESKEDPDKWRNIIHSQVRKVILQKCQPFPH